jgi:hypothetical protein
MSQPFEPTKVPRVIHFAVWVTFLNTWALFEETVVDRYGLWQYMPLYRVARFCTWDVAAMILLGFLVRRLLRPAAAA